MSASHPPKLDYVTPGSDRRPFSTTVLAIACGNVASYLPLISAVLALAWSITFAPRLPIERMLLAVTLLVVGGLLWLSLLTLRTVVSIRRLGDSPRSRWSRLAFIAFPVLVVGWIVGSRAMVVPRLAAWLSTPAAQRIGLQPAVAVVSASKLPDQRVGLFPATEIEPLPGGVTFTVGKTGVFGVYGYCYTEAGNPRPPSEWQGPTVLHHLGGNWWLWEWVD